jgi:hypothetical protein
MVLTPKLLLKSGVWGVRGGRFAIVSRHNLPSILKE